MNNNFTLLLSALNAADKPTFSNLRESDVTIFEADDPGQLAGILDAQDIDLIVFDTATATADHIGLMDGIPAIGLTADHLPQNSLMEFSRNGIIHFIFRPISVDEVRKLVTHYREIALQSARAEQLTTVADAAKMETAALAYSISHDLMAPVRAINGYSKILGDDIGDKENPHVMQMLSRLQANST